MLSTPADKNLICTRLILCRPYGTVPGCGRYPGLRPGLHSAVPTGLFLVVIATQDHVLGYTLPSLRDWFAICLALTCFPRMLSTPADQENPIWTRLTLCRPYGTGSRSALSADLFSAKCCPHQLTRNLICTRLILCSPWRECSPLSSPSRRLSHRLFSPWS